MMHAVDSDWQTLQSAALAQRKVLSMEAKEFAPCRPMKHSRARRICALRVKVLAQGSLFHDRQARVCRVRVTFHLTIFALHFQLRDRGPEPAFEGFFNLMIIAVPVE